jgi:hypothetical protein
MLGRLALLFALTGCVRSLGVHTSHSQTNPRLASSRVYISFLAERWHGYEEDCGLGRLFGIGENECKTEKGELEGIESVETVVVDLHKRRCWRVAGQKVSKSHSEYLSGPVAFGDRTFGWDGAQVFELAGGARVATYRPAGVDFWELNAKWIERTPWPVDGSHLGWTLTQSSEGFALVNGERRIELGPNPGEMYWLGESSLAVGDGLLVDLEKGRIPMAVEPPRLEGYPRVGEYSDTLIIGTDNGSYWTMDARTRDIATTGSALAWPIGANETSLVFQLLHRRSILVFDVPSLRWAEISYERCLPKAWRPE